MRSLLCLLALVAPVFAHGEISRGDPPDPYVSVRLLTGGKLLVASGAAWKQVSLDEFKEHLAVEKARIDDAARKTGKSAYEVAGGASVFKHYVSLDAAPDTPWQHVQWLLAICAEEKIYKFRVRVGDKSVLVKLAVDAGLGPTAEGPPTEVLLTTHVLAWPDMRAKWGEFDVWQPTGVLYRLDGKEQRNTAALRKHLAAAQKAGAAEELDVVGVVQAAAKVPLGELLKVIDVYLAEKLNKFDFHGLSLPSRDFCAAKTLPYPEDFYPGKVARGEPDETLVSARVRPGGKLFVKVDGAWKRVTLNEFSLHLTYQKNLLDLTLQRQGRPGLERIAGIGYCGRYVSLDIDPLTPWMHVRWLLTICAEQRYYRLHLVAGARKMLAEFYVDRGREAHAAIQWGARPVKTHVSGREYAPVKWGDLRVQRPRKVIYRLADGESPRLAAVGERIKSAKTAFAVVNGKAHLVGRVGADARIPFREVMKVLGAYLDAGLVTVDYLAGPQVIERGVRNAATLPFPKREEAAADRRR